MDYTSFFLDLAKYIIAGTVVAAIANWMFWPKYNSHTFRLKMLDNKQADGKELLPLRFQAYERLILLIERINPVNMVVRLHDAGLSAADFQQLLVSEIRVEFQHNVTQQLYVSDTAWVIARQLKDKTVALIRNAAGSLPASATAKELSKILLSHLAEMDEDPYEIALRAIKNELVG